MVNQVNLIKEKVNDCSPSPLASAVDLFIFEFPLNRQYVRNSSDAVYPLHRDPQARQRHPPGQRIVSQQRRDSRQLPGSS